MSEAKSGAAFMDEVPAFRCAHAGYACFFKMVTSRGTIGVVVTTLAFEEQQT